MKSSEEKNVASVRCRDNCSSCYHLMIHVNNECDEEYLYLVAVGSVCGICIPTSSLLVLYSPSLYSLLN